MCFVQMKVFSRKASLAAACLCFISLGCNNQDAWHATTSPVKGSVRINGQVPKGAQVTFYPTSGSVDVRESKPWAIVDENGDYRLRTYEKGDGSPAGEYRATVIWRVDPSVQGSPDQLGGVFEKPEDSQWVFTIDENVTELPVIEITDAKLVQPKPKARNAAPSPFDETNL